jgi:hypothetical protein
MSDDGRRPKKRSLLKQKVRKFKGEYIESTKSKGGYSAEGKMKLLADVKQNSTDWTFAQDEALGIVWDAVWEEDAKHARRADRRQLCLFALDGFGYDRHETFADANTPGGMRKVNYRWMTARHDQGVARLHRLKATEAAEAADWHEQRAANSLVRCGSNLDVVLWNLRDDGGNDEGPSAPAPVSPSSDGPRPSGGSAGIHAHRRDDDN